MKIGQARPVQSSRVIVRPIPLSEEVHGTPIVLCISRLFSCRWAASYSSTLIAATTNALNGALLVQRPDYYRGKQWSIVGILILAIFGGIGGGVSRDVLLNKIPGALTNPWYLILCVLAGIVGMLISFKGGRSSGRRSTSL